MTTQTDAEAVEADIVEWIECRSPFGSAKLTDRILATLAARGFKKVPESSIDHQQKRGAAWDIIDEALNAYDSFMLDDDYEPYAAMMGIFGRMKERRDFYRATPEGA